MLSNVYSQANSLSSRRWRHNFLSSILAGSYIGGLPKDFGTEIFFKLKASLSNNSCSRICILCDGEIKNLHKDGVLAWDRNATVYQISNSKWKHRTCLDKAGEFLVLERPSDKI